MILKPGCYNWHRFYDPDTGRYITADPIGLEGGLNLYSYVYGDPVNLTDPTGQIPCDAERSQQCSQGCKEAGLVMEDCQMLIIYTPRGKGWVGTCKCKYETCEGTEQIEKPCAPDLSNTPESCAAQLGACLSGAKTAWQKAKCYIAFAGCVASNY